MVVDAAVGRAVVEKSSEATKSRATTYIIGHITNCSKNTFSDNHLIEIPANMFVTF